MDAYELKGDDSDHNRDIDVFFYNQTKEEWIDRIKNYVSEYMEKYGSNCEGKDMYYDDDYEESLGKTGLEEYRIKQKEDLYIREPWRCYE